MSNHSLAVTLLLVLVLYVCTSTISAQEVSSDLRDTKITINVENQPLGVVFEQLMSQYSIPIGFEESILDRRRSDYKFDTNLPGSPSSIMRSSDGKVTIVTTAKVRFEAKSHPITLDFENEKLDVVFTEIVRQMENYDWEINDGVVNIFPVKGRDEKFRQLLAGC